MSDSDRAKALLQLGENTCVLCKGDVVCASTKRGVAPMMEFIASGTDLRGFSAADRIVGRAAALLFALAGVKGVYAPVMSRKAVEMFSQFGVDRSYDTLAEDIVNREGTGPCPMEQAVKDIDDPQRAFEAIRRTSAVLRAGNREA